MISCDENYFEKVLDLIEDIAKNLCHIVLDIFFFTFKEFFPAKIQSNTNFQHHTIFSFCILQFDLQLCKTFSSSEQCKEQKSSFVTPKK